MSGNTRTVFLESGAKRLTMRPFRLSVMSGPDEGKTMVFRTRKVSVGGSPEADFLIEDKATSRIHLNVLVTEKGYRLQDAGSKNGTWIGNLRVGDAYLSDGLIFGLGRSLVQFTLEEGSVEIDFSAKSRFGNMLGTSTEMRRIFALLERIAPTDATVLVQGESGTGKELVAEAVHQESRRKDAPFVVFDCSAVPRDLIESELFGHVKGAFTGATSNRKGAFEQAHGGTLFLDELGELDIDLQPKLLRVLEKQEIKPVGSTSTRKVDVRIVAATNRNLLHEVQQGNFREDLFYRFEVIKVHLPPLRERADDLALLIEHFLDSVGKQSGKSGLSISYKTMEKLKQHRWPGNVRELKNFVERAALLADGDRIETKYLNLGQPREPASSGSKEHAGDFALRAVDEQIPFKEAKTTLVEDFETTYWTTLLERTDGNISKAARIAGVHRKSLEYILKKLDIRRSELQS